MSDKVNEILDVLYSNTNPNMIDNYINNKQKTKLTG